MNWQQFRQQWAFYLSHSLRDLMRNGARTVFALFCIATGVAAVVALQSLALMIGDELTINLAELNRGDIQIVASNDMDNPNYVTRNNINEDVFTEAGIEALREWANDENVDIQFGATRNFLTLTAIQESPRPISVIPILVEPDSWPFYGEVFSSEPEIKPLSDLFPDDQRNIVMSKRLALDNQLEIGDQISVAGIEEPLTIAYFVDDETEGSVVLRNGPAGIIGFIYYPLFRADEIGIDPLPGRAYIQAPLGRSIESLDESLSERFGENTARITTDELEEQNQQVADLVNDLILVMGLSSILIGGIGIINTMNVIVSRRTLEIAVLKTMGLKAWRVTLLFLVEATLMGIIGSIIGVLSGIGLSYLVRGVGEEVLRTSLSWRPYPTAWFSGFSLGVVITISFGFLPTLLAGQVRPAGVLRPNDIQLPTAGLTRSLSAILFTIFLFGLTLNTIVQGQLELPFSLALGLLGIIIGLFSGIMLANQGFTDAVPDDEATQRSGVPILASAVAAFMLIGLAVLNLFIELTPLIIYGIPLLAGGGIYALGRSVSQQSTSFNLRILRLTRQILLLGGAALLGGAIGGGLFITIREVLKVLYPDQTPLPYANVAIVVGFITGGLAIAWFRLRARRAAGTIGMALTGAAVLSVLLFGVGDLLNSLLDGTVIWDTIESFSVGIIIVEIITLALGATFMLMNGVVWLIARTPTFGSVDLKLAMRNINARKNRTAATMIGLIAGIGALSLITLTTSGVTSLLETQIETDIGGNIIVISRDLNTAEAVSKRLDSTMEGIESYTQFNSYQMRILAIDGELPELRGDGDFGDAADGNRLDIGRSENEEGIGFIFNTVDPTGNVPDYAIESGRYLTQDDIGQNVMVLREPFRDSLFDQLGVELGSEVTIRITAPPGSDVESVDETFTIIGIIARDSEQSATADTLQAPIGVIPDGIEPNSIFTIVQVEEEHLDAAVVEFAQISNAFAIEIGFLVQLAERLLDQLIAIPALVAILALVAGIAIIANTVALDTQERRRQIGVMKAVGLKGWRVLAQLMFENAFIGLIAGLIGVGIGLTATILVGVLGDAEQLDQTLQLAPALRLVAMAVLVAMAATLFSAWTAARETPMTVLRYE